MLSIATVLALASLGAASALAAPHGLVTANQVKQAFRAAGDPLFDTGFGAYGSPVTVLTTVKTHQSWTATVFVYPSVAKAGASYKGNLASWHADKIAATQLRNLVVTVSGQSQPRTHSKDVPLPALVLKALATVKSPGS